MKTLILIIALSFATTAFAVQGVATQSSNVTTSSTASSVSQGGSGGAVQIGCLVNCADVSAGTRDAANADVQVALINSEAAKVIAGTTQTIKNTPSVSGPNLTTSNDTCMGSTSGSFNIAGLGFGGGSSWVDDNCKMLKNSRELWNMGMKAASLALMCNDKANKEALELTGYECPQTTAARKAAEAMKVINGAALKSTDYLTFK